jgi:hypothetical protein
MFLCMFVKLWLLITFTTTAGTHISDTSSTIDDDNNLGRRVIIPVGAEGATQRLALQYQKRQPGVKPLILKTLLFNISLLLFSSS